MDTATPANPLNTDQIAKLIEFCDVSSMGADYTTYANAVRLSFEAAGHTFQIFIERKHIQELGKSAVRWVGHLSTAPGLNCSSDRKYFLEYARACEDVAYILNVVPACLDDNEWVQPAARKLFHEKPANRLLSSLTQGITNSWQRRPKLPSSSATPLLGPVSTATSPSLSETTLEPQTSTPSPCSTQH